MNKGFWNNLKKPIFVLAPMADVTDAAFRRIIAKYGKPPVIWTEFVSADGLARAPEEGRKRLLKHLEFSESERPIVAQFFTSNPLYMEQAAQLARELGFDGVDINMGCPDAGVEKQGAGAALIKNPALARELIRAAKRGAKMGEPDGIPVSVKTRIGYNKNELETWIPELLAEEPAVLTVHARTRKEMSKVPARWEHVKRAVEIRNELGKDTLIFGNGDAVDLEDARIRAKDANADGVMLGRAIFGNPWLFSSLTPDPSPSQERGKMSGSSPVKERLGEAVSIEEKLRVMVEHTKLFQELLSGHKNFAVMKKHYKAYVSGFDGAVELRAKLMETQNAEEVEHVVKEFLGEK